MEMERHYAVSSDGEVDTVYQLMRDEQMIVGTPAQYVDTCTDIYRADPEYKKNLEQLEHMANVITGPFVNMGGQNFASELFWGEVLGMTVGDHYFGKRWSSMLYGIMNTYFSAKREPGIVRSAQSTPEIVSSEPVADPVEQALAIIDAELELLEKEKYDLPDAYAQFGDEMSTELSPNPTGRYFVNAGYTFLAKIAFAVAKWEGGQQAYQDSMVEPNMATPKIDQSGDDQILPLTLEMA